MEVGVRVVVSAKDARISGIPHPAGLQFIRSAFGLRIRGTSYLPYDTTTFFSDPE